MKRDIIRIKEEKCTACGLCTIGCPEGALQIIDGKARLVSDLFCDGLGACIGDCPQGAIEIESREAEPYDERKVMANIVKAGPNVIKAHLQHLKRHGQQDFLRDALDFLRKNNIEIPEFGDEATPHACPGSLTLDLRGGDTRPQEEVTLSSELVNWPIQLQLLHPEAPYLKNAELVIAADCAPFAYPNFHQRFLKGKVLIIFCPKLDRTLDEYLDKLTEIFQKQDIKSISIVHMEVPCCSGIDMIVQRALTNAQKNIIIKEYTISRNGKII